MKKTIMILPCPSALSLNNHNSETNILTCSLKLSYKYTVRLTEATDFTLSQNFFLFLYQQYLHCGEPGKLPKVNQRQKSTYEYENPHFRNRLKPAACPMTSSYKTKSLLHNGEMKYKVCLVIFSSH